MASHAHAPVAPAAESGVVLVAASRDVPSLAQWRQRVIALIDEALDAIVAEAAAVDPAELHALAREAEEAESVECLHALLDRAVDIISGASA